MLFWLPLAFAASACLYASVGHGGGSAYLAVLALSGVATATAKPSALAVNIVVSSIALWRFSSQPWPQRLRPGPLLLGSIPMAFVGGGLTLPALYQCSAGLVLGLSSLIMWFNLRDLAVSRSDRELKAYQWTLVGGVIGLVSAMSGTGGGIFLSAGLCFLGIATQRELARLAALFILANSTAAFLGARALWSNLDPQQLVSWIAFAAVGGLLGAHYGSARFDDTKLRRLLAVVLMIAALKLISVPFR